MGRDERVRLVRLKVCLTLDKLAILMYKTIRLINYAVKSICGRAPKGEESHGRKQHKKQPQFYRHDAVKRGNSYDASVRCAETPGLRGDDQAGTREAVVGTSR